MSDNGNISRAMALMADAIDLLSSPRSVTPSSGLLQNRANGHAGDNQPRALRDNVQSPTSPTTSGAPDQRRATTSTVLQELRTAFQPYNARLARRPAFVRRGRVISERTWTHKFCCLGRPSDIMSPTNSARVYLQEEGLGDKIITARQEISGCDLKQILWSEFPKLNNIDFVLMRSIQGGPGKLLIKITQNESIPDSQTIIRARIGTIYIKPQLDLIDAEENSENATEVGNAVGPTTVENLNARDGGMDMIEVDGREVEQQNELGPTRDHLNHSGTLPTEALGQRFDLDGATLKDLREQIYAENEGYQHVPILRENLVEQIVGLFKDSTFSVLKKPKIFFLGEAGADTGALTREFFYNGILSFKTDKFDGYPLFEGQEDHRVPVHDSMLLRQGAFNILGKFMGWAGIHTDVSYIGLSPAIAKYLLTEKVTTETIFPIVLEDVPDQNIRVAISALENWRFKCPTEEEIECIREAAYNAGVVLPMSQENAIIVKENILYYYVIDRRRPELEAIKEGLNETPFLQYLYKRDYLHLSVFPNTGDLELSKSYLIQQLELTDVENRTDVLNIVTDFIHEISSVPKKLKDLLLCWTGWPILTYDKLLINCGPNIGRFKFQACANELLIPETMTREEIFRHLRLAIEFASFGFGNV